MSEAPSIIITEADVKELIPGSEEWENPFAIPRRKFKDEHDLDFTDGEMEDESLFQYHHNDGERVVAYKITYVGPPRPRS